MYFVVRVKTLSLNKYFNVYQYTQTQNCLRLMGEAGVMPVITHSPSSDSDVPYPASKSLILEDDVLLIPVVVVVLSFP